MDRHAPLINDVDLDKLIASGAVVATTITGDGEGFFVSVFDGEDVFILANSNGDARHFANAGLAVTHIAQLGIADVARQHMRTVVRPDPDDADDEYLLAELEQAVSEADDPATRWVSHDDVKAGWAEQKARLIARLKTGAS